MKKNLKTIISMFILTIIILINVVPLEALTIEIRTADVYATQSSDYVIKIPKSISLSGDDGSAVYNISLSGNISASDIITVVPSESFIMLQEGKPDIIANIIQPSTSFTYSDGVRPEEEVSYLGRINMEYISAGDWSGVFYFNIYSSIECTTDSVASSTTDITGEILSGWDIEQDVVSEYDAQYYVHIHYFVQTDLQPETCVTDGYIQYTCESCKGSYKEIIPASGHNYESVNTPSSCENSGYTTYTCTICGYSYVGDYQEALGHNYDGDSCTRCGAYLAGIYDDSGIVKDWDYFIDSNILAIDDNGELYNPNPSNNTLYEIQGKFILDKNVKSIRANTFSDCTTLTEIVIQNVEIIDDNAFKGCPALKKVTFLNDVKTIGASAFEGCSSLTTINIPNSVESIGKNAFYGCSSLKEINMSGCNVTKLEESTFENCSSLQTAVLPESLTTIGNRAFYNCSSLKAVTIYKEVLNIGQSAFESCSSLQSIVIPNKNIAYIGQYAFKNCYSLQTIVLQELTYVDKDAFNNVVYEKSLSYSKKVWINE